MSAHLSRAVDVLKSKLLNLCGKVEESLSLAVKSVKTRDVDLARKVIDDDSDIDNIEVEVEEECLKILALHQPVAIDLRFIITALKINNDLERIGDLAVNIAERSEGIAKAEQCPIDYDLVTMARKTRSMLSKSLDALVNMDVELACEVCQDDNEIDDINRQMYILTRDAIVKYPKSAELLIWKLSISKNLERVADHATNIAEDVIYMVKGQIVRHKG